VFSQKPVSGDGDFTFTRASAATRVNADGNIEKETQNLLNYSNNFGASYWIDNAGSCTRTGGQAGYDGTNDAWLLTQNGVTGFDNILSNSTAVSGVYTFSVYAKASSGNTQFTMRASSSTSRSEFNLTTGTIQASSGVIDDNIEDVGGGWYRCSVTFNASSDQFQIYPQWNSSSAQSVYIQDAQLEQGLVARDYIETTTAAVYGGITDNTPRLDYTDSSCPALLLEPQRTNIVPISEGVPEDSTAVTLTRNYGTSPEGVQNSLKVQKLGVNSNDRIYPIDNYNATLVSGNEYSLSAFVKNIDVDGITTIACRISGNTLFRLGYEWNGSSLTKASTYANGTRTNELLEDYGNGWWRIGFTFEADGTQGNIEIDVDRDNGSDTTSIETWGWQLESATGDASYATSYIPTYGSSVSRVNDEFDLRDVQTNGLVTSTQGTMFFHITDIAGVAVVYNIQTLNDLSYALRFVVRDSGYLIYQRVNNVQTTIRSASLTLSEWKIAMSWNGTSLITSLNGTSYIDTIDASIASQLDKIARVNPQAISVTTNQILVFPTQLTEAELNDLTTL
jgi:hypothetical protein